MTGLSRALLYQNKDEEAKQWARNALKYNPENYRAWYQLGFIEAKTNKPAAISDYEKAVAIQSNFAPLRRDLGLLYYQQHNYAEAAKHLAKAAELGVDDAPLWNFLGISYSRTNRLPKAIEFQHPLITFVIFTGTYPMLSGVHDFAANKLNPTQLTLASRRMGIQGASSSRTQGQFRRKRLEREFQPTLSPKLLSS